jgi:hypothetical protein
MRYNPFNLLDILLIYDYSIKNGESIYHQVDLNDLSFKILAMPFRSVDLNEISFNIMDVGRSGALI